MFRDWRRRRRDRIRFGKRVTSAALRHRDHQERSKEYRGLPQFAGILRRVDRGRWWQRGCDREACRRNGRARYRRIGVAGLWAAKNLALSLASGDWVLSVDADERISKKLAAEIRQAVSEAWPMPTKCRGCRLFAGGRCGIPAGIPDYVLRLFRRERARFSDDLVHERVICDGKVARLKEPLTPSSGRATGRFALAHGPLFHRARADD